METVSGELVFRQPLWKRVVQVFSGILFIAMGALLLFGQNEKIDLFIRSIGFLTVLFGLAAIYFSFKKSLIILSANAAGLIPVFVVGKKMTLVPWKNIKQFAKVTQKVRMNSFGYLAIYLNEPQELLDPVSQFSMQVGKNTMSDGGTADVYIPAFALPISLDQVIQKLEAFRAALPTQTV